ncbi:MAG: response regulator [Cyanobacteria bacterium SZAS LIN-2]|nr:response regulator [Cyanobacteria bacterium SZAS LIN-3]MBS1996032.1 response regulator [Cyanobacteria bacterium SZAS LIN-2]MBS2010447.1 response regulator [Cyanobacteria bacterium SZAS TMP-1]
MRRHKILVVDDEVPNLRLLRRVLSEEHDILEAEGGAAALKILKDEDISLIITDQRMPSMTGVQLLEQSLEINPDAIKILLTGYTDVQALIDAINAGHVYKYIPKPWDAEELKLTVRRALEAYELKENNDRLVVELSQAITDLESVSVGTIRALADALDAKCDYTAGHSLRVSRFAVLIGRQLGLSNDHLRDVELGGILHDIGKIGVPESILWKPGSLTPEEKAIMSKHPVTSAEIIGDLKGLWRAREYVKHHHEYYDGSGYPDGLKGDAIPIGARIILVSDAYDAMTTDRPYREAIGHERAVAELKKMSGKQFDPAVVDALMAFIGDDGREIDRVLAEEFPDSFIGLTLPSVDPAQTGRQYRAEAARRARLAGSEAG